MTEYVPPCYAPEDVFYKINCHVSDCMICEKKLTCEWSRTKPLLTNETREKINKWTRYTAYILAASMIIVLSSYIIWGKFF